MPGSQKSLQHRIFITIFLLSVVVLIASATTILAATYFAYESNAEQRLLSSTQTTAKSFEDKSPSELISLLEKYPFFDKRVTLIADDGVVLFDNYVDPSTLDNHGDREEVQAAKSGQDTVLIRQSDTLGSDTIYAATKLNNGYILRFAESRTTLPVYLESLMLPILIMAICFVLLSFIIARLLTKRTMRPLLEVNLKTPLENEAYAELQPLLERVDEQRKELIAQNSKLEQSFEARREFTGNVSHEMKSPLQVIGGYAELIELGVTSPEDTKRFAGLIRTEAKTMRTLIDDVLVLSKLDEGVEQSEDLFDLGSVCKRVIERLQEIASERNSVLSQSVEDGVIIQGSESLAEQMIYNLVENGLRYGHPKEDQGQVEIKVYSDNGKAMVIVSDNGPGVPDEAKSRIFERFYRVDTSRSRETGGTGLGLAIVKHAALTLNGSVEVTNSELGGAEFKVVLPINLLKQ